MLGNRMEKKNGGNSGGGQLLQELEALSKALYRGENPPKRIVSAPIPGLDYPHSRSGSVGKTHRNDSKPVSQNDFSDPKMRAFRENPSLSRRGTVPPEKKGLWSWKPLRALAHVRSRRYTCSLSLQVHSVEGLSMNFSGMSLVVHWRRRDGGLQTKPAKVSRGVAEFKQTLSHNCSVYGSGTGPNQTAKYDTKQFQLYVTAVGSPELDLGKHKIDLTRLLPDTLEGLEKDKRTGNWTMNFKLSGKAKGAILVVTFGYSILGDALVEPVESGSSKDSTKTEKTVISNAKPMATDKTKIGMKSMMGIGRDERSLHRRIGSLPGTIDLSSRSPDDAKILHEVLPSLRMECSDLGNSGPQLRSQELDEGGLVYLTDSKPKPLVFSMPDELQPALELKSKPFAESGEERTYDDTEFTVIEQGMEVTDPLSKATHDLDSTSKESTRLDEIDMGDKLGLADVSRPVQALPDCIPAGDSLEHDNGKGFVLGEYRSKESELLTEESAIEELAAAFGSSSPVLEADDLDYLAQEQSPSHGHLSEVKSKYWTGKLSRSHSLDDVTESVANEFLNMLGIVHSPFSLSSDSDPESPRGRLWKQFERDALASGNGLFGLDVGDKGGGPQLACSSFQSHDVPPQSNWGLDEDFELPSIVLAAEAEHQKATQAMKSKTRAKILEDAETEVLMREWGLNEKVFEGSPPNTAGGFGSPIYVQPEQPLELPLLGDGLGPFVQTKDGGFIRSMNPSLFRNSKNNGSLIMQVSSPVVVPAEMGSGIMEILQCLASAGIEKLSMQANKLMPLEDITGKTIQQVAWEAAPALEEYKRQVLLQNSEPVSSDIGQELLLQDTIGGRKKGSSGHKSKSNLGMSIRDTGSEYVSLEDLAPLAMDKIEALSIEGLKIQSGMSDEDAPSNVSPQSIGEISALAGMSTKTSGLLGLEGTGGLQLLDIKDSGDPVDGLMGLSITLDEWMKLDAGIIDEEQEGSDRTSKILAAHHASCTELVSSGFKDCKGRGRNSGRKWGFMGNNFTVALMVQLRDPMRNYEPVGAPMLSLIQVERVVVPPKPKIYYSVSVKGNSEEADEPDEPRPKEEKKEETKEENKEEEIPQFRIKEVHLVGLKTEKTEPGKKKLWGNSAQQQSGSRWLLANGMGKSNKHPFMKSSKAVSKPQQVTTTVKPGDTLWSISSRVHGTGAKWKDLAALNPHIRNPNVIFPNETIRLC